MNTQLFDKTDKGRDEINTRRFHLAPRLRTLLLLVDGKNTVDQLLQKVAGIGLDESALTDLLDQQFIREADIHNTDMQAMLNAITDAPSDATSNPISNSTAEQLSYKTREATASVPITIHSDIELQTLHQFFSATIKSTLGIRGFALQIKVDRATSVADFQALREAYLAAILKASGPEMKRILADRLDLILQGRK